MASKGLEVGNVGCTCTDCCGLVTTLGIVGGIEGMSPVFCAGTEGMLKPFSMYFLTIIFLISSSATGRAEPYVLNTELFISV